MTVNELIKLLWEYNPAAEVDVTWQGRPAGIFAENIYAAKNGVVLIDADNNFYRDDYVTGRRNP